MEFSGGQPRRLTPPPRHVPAGLKISLLFGGPLNMIGWFFLGFGGIFFWIFALNGDYSFITFSGVKLETTGVITRSEKTNASEGGSDTRPGTPIYANYFRFSTATDEIESVSYATGRSLGSGTQVQVEYLASNPRQARIKNMRRALFPPFVAFVIIFPVIGLGFVAAMFRKGIKSVRLLRVGRSTTGKLRSKIPTNLRINNQQVYRLTFDYTARDGRSSSISVRTHETELLEDDESERLFYDPSDLENGITLDDLPGNAQIDLSGNFLGSVHFSTLGTLLVPVATIVGHGWWIYIRYLAI